jgi:hypothetical protein
LQSQLLKNRSAADGVNPKYDLIKTKQPSTVFEKIHTSPPPGTTELRKQVENLSICDKLTKQIKPIFGPNMGFCADYETEFTST